MIQGTTPVFPLWVILLQSLKESKFMFYLTGSRAFDPQYAEANNSDWDFFTEDTPEVRDFLVKLGFSVTESYGNIQDSKAVFRHESGRVDVQLVSDPVKKDNIQSVLKKNTLNCVHLTKAERKRVWDTAYAVYKAYVPQGEWTYIDR